MIPVATWQEEREISDEAKRLLDLAPLILKNVENNDTAPGAYQDMLCVMEEIRDISGLYHKRFHGWNRHLQRYAKAGLKRVGVRDEVVGDLLDAYGKSLLMEAPYDFDQYMLYMEYDRPVENRFYLPRKRQLKPIVDALQELEDRKIEELFLSQPPRTGKTTLLDFFFSWEAGKYPERSNLYSSCSDTVTTSFYNGLLELMRDPFTYHWQEIFPDAPIVKLNADKQTVNVLTDSRFPTITCRSIDGTLNGACDCDNILCGDDLCKGIEQAVNKDVMLKLWQKVMNDLDSRAKQTARRIWIGTRWSLIDPIGSRLDLLENDKAFENLKYKVINLPALDDKGQSNFNYKYNKGFSTADYEKKRAQFERAGDMASWLAQYMGSPVERSGSLFTAEDMRFYNGQLPEGEPARIFMAVDPAWGGGDFCAAPVCVQYGTNIFVPAVVYTDADKTMSTKEIVTLIEKYGVSTARIEATKTTMPFADEVRVRLRDAGLVCSIETKPASTTVSKEDRIKDRAPEIKENFVFLEPRARTRTYQRFMDNVYSFTLQGRNKHDDAPDSLSMAADMVFRRGNIYGQVFKRFF